uniref:Uncharacterized protein n=1 Tax=Strigamia maritima TaxID=126957 RepID=T1IK14_STRMM
MEKRLELLHRHSSKQPLNSEDKLESRNKTKCGMYNKLFHNGDGEYVCRASNELGEDFTRCRVECLGRGTLFFDSLQPRIAMLKDVINQIFDRPRVNR